MGRLVPSGAPLLRRVGHDRVGAGTHDPGLPAWSLQVPARTDLGPGRVLAPVYTGHVLHRADSPVGPRRLLGPGRRRLDGRAGAGHWALGRADAPRRSCDRW